MKRLFIFLRAKLPFTFIPAAMLFTTACPPQSQYCMQSGQLIACPPPPIHHKPMSQTDREF
jgi:hypothetical protein